MYLLKVKTLIIFSFITITNAYNFKLCCPFAHEYNNLNQTCSSSLEPQNLTIYKSTEEVNKISGKVLNVINYAWCRNDEGLRETEEITDQYYLQENGTLYIPSTQKEYFKSNRFCLNIIELESDNSSLQSNNYPIICKFEEIEEYSSTTEYSTTRTISNTIPTTISIDTTSSDDVNCECNTEPPKFPEFFCENLLNGFEKCVKCTIENECNKNECTTNISLIEFVNVLKDTAHVVQVNKKKCPYWKYTYNLNKNNTVHLSILNQTCDEPKNTKASFNVGVLFYVGIAFLIIVVLALLGIIIYVIKQKRADAVKYAAFLKEVHVQETELNPMFRPQTAIYSLPEDSTFK